MLKSCKDLSLGEVAGAHVMSPHLSYFVPSFPVISSFVLPVGRITTVAMIASKYCFH
jgi:hypothetical protein